MGLFIAGINIHHVSEMQLNYSCIVPCIITVRCLRSFPFSTSYPDYCGLRVNDFPEPLSAGHSLSKHGEKAVILVVFAASGIDVFHADTGPPIVQLN